MEHCQRCGAPRWPDAHWCGRCLARFDPAEDLGWIGDPRAATRWSRMQGNDLSFGLKGRLVLSVPAALLLAHAWVSLVVAWSMPASVGQFVLWTLPVTWFSLWWLRGVWRRVRVLVNPGKPTTALGRPPVPVEQLY